MGGAAGAIFSGGASLLGAGAGAGAQSAASEAQLKAAMEALRQQERLGREGAAEITGRGDLALKALGRGFRGFEEAQQDAIGLFDQQRAIGGTALERLANALLTGEGLTELANADPTLQLQRSAGEQALQRAAAATGTLGSGGNLSDFARLNQQFAQQGIDRALSRLGGLADIGIGATQNVSGLLQNLGAARSTLGANLAAVQQGIGSGVAGALRGIASNQIPLQQTIGQAAGLAAGAPGMGLANAFNTLGALAPAYAAQFGGGGGFQSAPAAQPLSLDQLGAGQTFQLTPPSLFGGG